MTTATRSKAPKATTDEALSRSKDRIIPLEAVAAAVLLAVLAYCWGLGDGKTFSDGVDEVVHVTFWCFPREMAVGIHWVFSFIAALGAITIGVSSVPSLANRRVVKAGVVMTTIATVYQLIIRTVAFGAWDPRSMTCIVFAIIVRMYSPKAKMDDGPSLFGAWVVSLRVPPFAALIAPVTISIITMELFGAPVISAERATTAVLALLLLQAAANQINSVADFFNGVDDIHTASDRSLVDGILTPKAMVWSAVALTGLSGALLLVNIPEIESSYRGYVTLSWIAQASFAILYTSGPFPLKYYAMGDLVILLAFGPSVSALMALWASDPTRSLPVLPGVFAFTLPSILVTIGVLNANNIRDLDSDAAVGIYTVANILGHRWCRIYFGVLQLLPHIISLWLAYAYHCYGILFSLAVIPRSLSTISRICLSPQSDPEYKRVVKYASHTTLMYGLASAMGISTAPIGVGLDQVSSGGVLATSAVIGFLYCVG